MWAKQVGLKLKIFCGLLSPQYLMLLSFQFLWTVFFMVVYPLQHRYWMKGKTMATWLACIWLVGVIYPAKKLAFENGRYHKLVGTFFGLTMMILSSAAIYGATYFKLQKQTRNSVSDPS